MKYLFLISILFTCCNTPSEKNSNENASEYSIENIGYKILKTYPHDTSYFTEGLEIYDSLLYESTGLENQSYLIKMNLAENKILQKMKHRDTTIFGEGITIFNDTLYQLTYKNKKVFVYDAINFKKIKELPFPKNEGWGMTHDTTHIIAGDGTNQLYFIDPSTFKIISTLHVSDNYGPSGNLNELEYVHGFIYANVWQENTILKIDPASGNVVGKIDLTGILDKAGIHYDKEKIDVLNGIAYLANTGNFLITGKKWPVYVEISLEE